MRQNRACEVCGNDRELSDIKKIRYYLPVTYKIPSEYDIVSCEKCGFCYANVLASLSDYDDYYMRHNSYCKEILGKAPDNLPKDAVMDLLCSLCDKDDKILDIGFGKGELLLLLQRHGFRNLFGIDPSEESVEHMRKSGIRAETGSIYTSDSLEEKMNMVVVTDVLEHLLKPSLALEKISSVLRDGGLLYVSVPNCLNLERDTSPLCNNFNQEHINYFSVTSLKNLMARYGFKEEKMIAEAKYTDIFAVFSYHERTVEDFFEKDIWTREAIKAYIKYNDRRETHYNRILEKYVRDQIPVAVWGTGSFTMSLLVNTDLRYCRIECFIDNNEMRQKEQFWGGKAVIAADGLCGCPCVEAVVVSSIRSSAEIRRQLLEMGWEDKKIIVLEE